MFMEIPDHAQAGYCLRKCERFEDAVAEYDCVNSPSERDLNNRAFCLARLGQYTRAIDDYTKAL